MAEKKGRITRYKGDDTDDTMKYGPTGKKLNRIEYQHKEKSIQDYLNERDKMTVEKRQIDAGNFMHWLTWLKKRTR